MSMGVGGPLLVSHSVCQQGAGLASVTQADRSHNDHDYFMAVRHGAVTRAVCDDHV